METPILKKYNREKDQIKPGDFTPFSGDGLIANVIKEASNSKTSHIGVVDMLRTRRIIIDSNAPGTHPDWLSGRIKSYGPKADFCVIRSKKSDEEISAAMNVFVEQKNDDNSSYDFVNGIKELLNRICYRFFKIRPFRTKYIKGKDICSMSVKNLGIALNVFNTEFYAKGMDDKDYVILPDDFLVYRNIHTTDLLFNY